jgi:hypothetical protein
MALTSLPTLALLLTLGGSVRADDETSRVELKITQRHLEPLCLDGASVKLGQREWRLSLREHSLAFTMRNQPREGAPAPEAPAGVAVVTFTPEAGHKYDVEVRADETSYARRVWRQGEWRPVIRDRTAERIVSTHPVWSESPCQP